MESSTSLSAGGSASNFNVGCLYYPWRCHVTTSLEWLVSTFFDVELDPDDSTSAIGNYTESAITYNDLALLELNLATITVSRPQTSVADNNI